MPLSGVSRYNEAMEKDETPSGDTPQRWAPTSGHPRCVYGITDSFNNLKYGDSSFSVAPNVTHVL